MSNSYRCVFLVGQQSLAVLMAVLEKEKSISLESCSVVETKAKKMKRYVNGRKNKGITGEELILEMTKGGQAITFNGFSTAFKKKGFATSSVSASLSKAKADGLIAQDKDGNYRRKPKAVAA